MARIFLDSNIFLYAMGVEHAEKPPCQRLLEMVADGRIEAVTNSDILPWIPGMRSTPRSPGGTA